MTTQQNSFPTIHPGEHRHPVFSPPYNVVFMGCPEFAIPPLQALLDDSAFRVPCVYSMPDRPKGRGKKEQSTPVKEFALGRGLPVRTPASFRRDPSAVAELREWQPDFLVVVAYGLILPLEVLRIPRIAPVNLHASLLPRHRGPSPIHFALMRGESETGNSVMVMNERMDEGDTLIMETTPIHPGDTFVDLHDRLSRSGAVLLAATLRGFAQGQLEPKTQNHAQSTYTTKITPEMARMVWQNPAGQLHNLARAMFPSPGAWFEWQGERWKIGHTATGEHTTAEPGTVIATNPISGICVACGGRSSLWLEAVQRPGKAMMPAGDFLRGYKGTLTGTQLR